MLGNPHPPGQRMNRGALNVAMAERENGRACSRLGGIRVVVRGAAIVEQANHFAGVIIRSLSTGRLAAITQRDVQRSIATERQACAVVRRTRRLRLHAKDHLCVLQRAIDQPRPQHFGASPTRALRDVREIDPAGLHEPRMHRDVQ